MSQLFKRVLTYPTAVFPAILVISVAITTMAKELTSGPDPRVLKELEYAEALTALGMPDYAEIILNRIHDPAAKVLLRVIKIRGLIAMGKFDEVKAIIAREPDQAGQEVWAMKLSLADGFYAWGRYGEAQGIYNSFFEKFPDGPLESLKDFYLNSAYKYAQMLLLMGRETAALEAYGNALKALPKGDKKRTHIRRQVLGEMSELMVKLAETTSDPEKRQRYFEIVDDINNEILWVQDLWFGKAIVLMAHRKKIDGDIEGAQKLVSDYKKQLEQIDKTLKEEEEKTGEPLTKLSPMAEVRYLLGVIMQEAAEKLMASDGDKEKIIALLAGKELGDGKRSSGALHHFMNVFIRYPGTCWAPDAGSRARKIEEILKTKFGAKIKSKVSNKQMEKVEKFQFQEARILYNQQQFEKAVESYIKVLNLFPENETSVSALGELGRCYIELENELYADMVMRYLAERFSHNAALMLKAGNQLLRNAEIYGERKVFDKKDALYDLYFSYFTNHPRAPAIIFRFGEGKFKDGDIEGALGYYKQIEENYPDSPIYLDAISKAAYCYSKFGKYKTEIKMLNEYIQKLEKKPRPGHALINAKFRLAAAYKQLGPKYIPSAFNRYSELVKLLSDKNKADQYASDSEEAEKNRKVLEGAMFYKAFCYSMLTKPAKKLKTYKLAAIKILNKLVTDFPESSFAPPALSQVGTLWTVLEKPQEARKALQKLQKEYPDSMEAQNALFMLGNNLLKLDMKRQATKIFKEMFSGSGTYSDAQILMAGSELLKAGEYEIALDAFNRVLASSSDARISHEPSMLGKGKALIELKKYDEGAKILEQMLKQYPNTGYTVEVCFYLNRAYAQLGMREADEDKRFDLFNNAVKAMQRVRRFVQTDEKRAESDIGVAKIFKLKSRAEEQFGTKEKALKYKNDAIATYQIMIMTANLTDPKVGSYIEDAYHECIPLLLETERWEDAIEDCDKYLELFPRGKYLLDIRKWRNKAKLKLATQAALQPQAELKPGPGPGEEADR